MSRQDSRRFTGRLALQQRVLPVYRRPFVDRLASACRDGLSVFAGKPHPDEALTVADRLEEGQFYRARNRHVMGVDHPLYVCWQDGLVSWLNAWDPDVLIAEANPRYLSTGSAIRWMHERSRPVVGWGLGAPRPTGILASWRLRLRAQRLRQFDALIAYSQRGAEEYRVIGIPAERVFVATNAVTPRPTRPAPERPAQFEDQPTILFIGRIQKRKRIDLLLRACAALSADRQPRLWLVGEGPARAHYEAMAAEIYPKASFFGEQRGEQLKPYLQQADLFVLPGTGGLAVQQAMASGLPVIVAEGDGTQEDLVGPKNGWLIPANNLSALSQAIQTALTDPLRLRQMGAESYRIVSHEANVDVMVTRFVEILMGVLGEANR